MADVESLPIAEEELSPPESVEQSEEEYFPPHTRERILGRETHIVGHLLEKPKQIGQQPWVDGAEVPLRYPT
jgi:hypothetical protein